MPSVSSPFEYLDSSEGPLASTDLMRATFEARRTVERPSVELEADLLGLELGTPRDGDSAWGTRYGPWTSASGPGGREIHFPPRELITSEVMEVWKRRALSARHPYLRFRFADLVWDLAEVVPVKPEVSFARLAIDSAMEGLATGSFKYPVEAFKAANRALELARMINDPARALAVERAIFAFETAHGKDTSENTWGHVLELVVEKESSLPPGEQDAVVSAMEARLTRLAGALPHPHTVEAAALPLAEFYRQHGRTDDVARVLRVYVGLVVAAGRKMQGMAAASFLDRLHAVLEDFGLRADAAALSGEMQVQGQRSVSELKQFGTTIRIPAEEMAEAVDSVLSGTAEEALKKIAFWFVPEREDAVVRVRELATEAPLMADMPKVIVDKLGQKIGMVGSVEDDMEGNVVQHIAQRLQFMAAHLRATLDAARVRIGLGVDILMPEVRKSPVFDEDKLPLVELGLRAYFSDQYAVSVHVLVPQIEAAIRRLAIISGVMPYRRKKKDLELRSLGNMLADPQLEGVLDARLAFYLRILLTDLRGWNIRNEVCHGLSQAARFGPVVADRVLHVILLLMWIRKQESAAVEPGVQAP